MLVPIKRGVKDFKDFTPISLVVGLYKLLAKVSVNRSKKVVAKWFQLLNMCIYVR